MATTRLTNLQQELLKIFSRNIDENELIEIKHLLVDYFANKASDEADKIWDEKGYSDETMDSWLNEENQ